LILKGFVYLSEKATKSFEIGNSVSSFCFLKDKIVSSEKNIIFDEGSGF